MSITPGQISATNINIKKIDQVLINNANVSYVNNWTDLSALEPAMVNKECVIRNGLSASSITGRILARRGNSVWGIPGADTLGLAYLASHQVPAPTYNPFRSHIYLAPAAAELAASTEATVISTAGKFNYITTQALTWSRVRLWMADVNGGSVAPTGIWFALCDGGNADNPSIVGSWVAASGFAAPPNGTDDSPGIGPVCAYTNLAGNSTSHTIAIRIQMPAGTYSKMSGGTGTDPATSIPEWQSNGVFEQTNSISSDPGTSSGWSNAFSKIPHFWLEVDGLSEQQCLLGCVGDSHTRGYMAEYGGAGYRGMFGEIMSLKGSSRISLVNFGRAGHTTAQISSRLHAIESQMDIGGWMRQRASINDRYDTGSGFDYLVPKADDAYAQLQADYAYVNSAGKIFIPYQGFGMAGVSGWYGRFNTHLAEELASYPWSITTADAILDANGEYDATMGGPDAAHPSALGYETVATPTWSALQASLLTFGVTV